MRAIGQIISLAALFVFAASDAADAEDAAPRPDKSAYSLLNPTPDSQLRDLSSDRPTKSTLPITVDAGHFQIEMDVANYSFGTYAGVTTKGFLSADPIVKLGLTSSIDLEIGLGSYQSIRAYDATTHALLARGEGFGDLLIRPKFNFLGNDGGSFAFSILPFVTIPTSTPQVSAGVLQGGAIASLQFNLPGDFTLVSSPEFDLVKNANDFGRHAAYRWPTSLGHAIPGIDKLTGYVEFFAQGGSDAAIPPVYTFDLGLGYLLTPNCQLDGGANIGLNTAAPALQLYAGMTQRF